MWISGMDLHLDIAHTPRTKHSASRNNSQICRFCWHHIKANLNGRCPACRKPYDDAAVEFKPMKPEELKRLQAAKKQREKEKKEAETNARRHAANVRVRQRAQVHIQGMTTKIANEDVSAIYRLASVHSSQTYYMDSHLHFVASPDPPLSQRARSVRTLWQDPKAFLFKTCSHTWTRRTFSSFTIILLFHRPLRTRQCLHQLLQRHRSQCVYCRH